MKKNVLVLAVVVVLISLLTLSTALAAGKNGPAGKGKSNVGHLYLYEKTPIAEGPWLIKPDGAWGKMTYKRLGDTLDFVFNGHGLSIYMPYKLIAYNEAWPAVAVLGDGTSNGGGEVHIKNTYSSALPVYKYPTVTGKEYDGCGTKIWLVLAGDVEDDVRMKYWNQPAYLFEGDLIYSAASACPSACPQP